MEYRAAFCTLDDVYRQLQIADAPAFGYSANESQIVSASDDGTRQLITSLIYSISDYIAHTCNYSFVPYEATIAHRLRWARSHWQITFRDALTTLDSVQCGAVDFDATEYDLEPFESNPKSSLNIYTLPSCVETNRRRLQVNVSGTWGYHEYPGRMWQASGQTLGSSLNSSATSITVGSGVNFDTLGYIKIDDEVLQVTAIAGGVLTVERGVLGTTAASHNSATAIYIYRQMDHVMRETVRMVIRAYQLRSEINIFTAGEAAIEVKLGTPKNLPTRFIGGVV